MNYDRLEKIGNISGIIASAAAGILILIVFVPGLKENEWITKHVVSACGFVILFFGGLLLSTSMGINVIRSGELAQMILFISFPMPKPIARMFGFCFFLIGSMAFFCALLLLFTFISVLIQSIADL
ncbi:hypothetical protein [Leptospira yasudae]|uniref:Uncharacterized protein n=1 Tax=Leptospira yasudae TaxID=2202201 RepID=A0ABX9LXU3_9LEPT|nr:hypothetical protein [Leptospira yasudae]RHX77699.1 hypothetical protein DLM77_19880 [Leptospira yasudae]